MSITDELVAELEALASECGQHGANWYEPRHMAAFPEYACDQDFVVAASPATILALLAERAELMRDAERYRWLRDRAMATKDTAPAILLVNDDCEPAINGTGWQSAIYGKDADVSVDAAMELQS